MKVPEGWYAIAESREVRGAPVGVTRFGEALVLWRSGDQIAAASDTCPHRGAAMSLGAVVDGCVTCPFHGFRFDRSGACVEVPAKLKVPQRMRLDTRTVREAHGWIYLWVGAARDAYPALPWFEDMPDLPSAWFADDWPVHWTRAVENQLDYSHLAFVHRRTIGRFTSADAEMTLEVDPDLPRIRSYSGADREQLFIEWSGPNVWRNKIGPNMWVQAAFVPIDEETARTYVRFAQGLITAPVLGDLFCWVMNPLNKVILGEDRRVVVSQRPLRGETGNGDLLVGIDDAIAAFRAWYNRGMKARYDEPTARDPAR